ncbi:MAG TPA: ABC transporter permease [Verrucomicrobiae bacterium]|nr:ABC transporter permease [Verrucomicrobiae bacterium]
MTPTLVIEAGRTERQYWQDLWRFRELFYFLAWRDFLIRYKQTIVGVSWSLIKPLLTMLILTMVSRFAHLPTGGVPASLFIFSALLPWQFFSTAMSESGNSLVTNSNLVSKVYFPRLVVPASSVLVSFVDFVISGLFLVVLMFYFHFIPSSKIIFLPAFVALIFGAAVGTGLWIAALTVRFRDFRFIVPFLVQFGLYASPVILMTSHVNEKWRLLYCLNPIVGIIDGFRWSILGGENILYRTEVIASVVGVILLVASGLWFFRKFERTMADMI